MRALILGAGPAGLMATHAAYSNGYEPMVFSHKARKSRMYGAQYLHREIPGIDCGERFDLQYILYGGTPTDYVQKVYGDRWDGTVSEEIESVTHDAWDIRRAYDDLWQKYGGAVESWSAEHPWDIAALIDDVKPDVAISSIPTQLLCMNDCDFKQIHFWSTAELPAENPYNRMFPTKGPDYCIYNGGSEPWYRLADIKGHITAEWPYRFGPPTSDGPVWNVVKPMSTNCECFPNIIRVGRYGNWTRGILTHHAFEKTLEAVS